MRRFFQAIIILTSAVLIYFGSQRGEVEIIFKKAVHICLECVGLG